MKRFVSMVGVLVLALVCSSCGSSDAIVGKWGLPSQPGQYWHFRSSGSLEQKQMVNFKSGRQAMVTSTGTWSRSGNTVTLKITKNDPPDVTVADSTIQIVEVTAKELKFSWSGGPRGSGTQTLQRLD